MSNNHIQIRYLVCVKLNNLKLITWDLHEDQYAIKAIPYALHSVLCCWDVSILIFWKYLQLVGPSVQYDMGGVLLSSFEEIFSPCLFSFELVLKLRTLSLCKTAINKIGRRFGSSPYSVCEMSEPLQKKNINNVNNKQTNKQTKNLRLHTHGECAYEYVNTFVYFVFQRAKAVSFAWSGSFHILKPVNVIIGHFEEPF